MALASPGTRLTARLVDLLVVFVLGSVLAAVRGLLGSPALVEPSVLAGPSMFVIVAAAYETVLIATKGQTLGKMATRIRIVRADDGAIPGWGASAARWALPAFASVAREISWVVGVESGAASLLGLVGFLVYASLLWDKRRQGWHDMVARTLVINTPTQTALSNRIAVWLGIAFAVLTALLAALIIWAFASLGF